MNAQTSPRRVTRARVGGWGCVVTAGLCLVLLGGYLAWAIRLPPGPAEPSAPAANGYPMLLLAASHLQPNMSRDGESAVLREFRKAIRQPSVVPNAPDEPDLRAVPVFRGASTVFAAEAVRLAAAGRPQAAVDAGLDAAELGSRVAGGYQEACFGGLFCAKVGRRAARLSISSLSATEAAAAGQRCDRVGAELCAIGDVVDAMEREAIRTYRRDLMERPSLELTWGTVADRWRSLSENAQWLFRAKPYFYSRRRRQWDRRRLRFARAYPAQGSDPEANAGKPWSTEREVELAYERLSLLFTRDTAYMRLFRLQLALQEFRGAHGSFPKALSELEGSVPGETFIDPFTERSLVYRREGDGYVLYGFGPDGKDDGGRPIGPRGWAGSSPQEPDGDIVARASVRGTASRTRVTLTGPD